MKKFGTFAGVFVPSFEAIFGAVLFLILPMLIGEMGLSKMVVIILLANTLTIATTFSIADCATNLQSVGGGGMYAIAKRSLGKAFGGSIGIQLFLAQAVSIGFYATGFADPLQEIISKVPFIKPLIETYGISVLQQKQILATLIATIAFVAGLIGADFVSKLQTIIFVILIVSVSSIFITPFLEPTRDAVPVFRDILNISGSGLKKLGFWAAFTTFFPAVTGIDAGVGMSGNLKDPRKSLAKGTFIAIGVTSVGYLAVAWILSYINPDLLADSNGQIQTAVMVFSESLVVKSIILAGILFATGSSALAYFLTSPRTAQALARDDVLPGFLSFLGKDFTKEGNEPRWATVITFCIVVPIIWLGDIGFVSRIVGICFLVVYGWVNLAAFFERISGNPSFRPTSKNHWLISLYGFGMAMSVIAMDNILIGLGVFVSQLVIFLLLLRYKSQNRLEGVWWGLVFSLVNWGFEKMQSIIQGTKNWRPVLSVFCFADKEEDSLSAIQIGRMISDYKGVTMINVLKPSKVETPAYNVPEDAELISLEADNYNVAIRSMIQGAVPGGFFVNTVLLPLDNRIHMVDLIEDIMRTGRNVLIYKERGIPASDSDRIDVWWKGQENGNLMALLAYMIIQSERELVKAVRRIRLIRRLNPDEDAAIARKELEDLMQGARLPGEILILPNDNRPIFDTYREHSFDASLIVLGMPGKRAGGIARMFDLDKLFFEREIEKYKSFPPVLFVKAARVMDLLE